LDIKTLIKDSSDYNLVDGKSQRLIDLFIQSGSQEYVSGPAAKNYLDESIFNANKIKVIWFNYDNYPTYHQLWGNFEHNVSIIDLLFNCGKNSKKYMKYLEQ